MWKWNQTAQAKTLLAQSLIQNGKTQKEVDDLIYQQERSSYRQQQLLKDSHILGSIAAFDRPYAIQATFDNWGNNIKGWFNIPPTTTPAIEAFALGEIARSQGKVLTGADNVTLETTLIPLVPHLLTIPVPGCFTPTCLLEDTLRGAAKIAESNNNQNAANTYRVMAQEINPTSPVPKVNMKADGNLNTLIGGLRTATKIGDLASIMFLGTFPANYSSENNAFNATLNSQNIAVSKSLEVLNYARSQNGLPPLSLAEYSKWKDLDEGKMFKTLYDGYIANLPTDKTALEAIQKQNITSIAFTSLAPTQAVAFGGSQTTGLLGKFFGTSEKGLAYAAASQKIATGISGVGTLGYIGTTSILDATTAINKHNAESYKALTALNELDIQNQDLKDSLVIQLKQEQAITSQELQSQLTETVLTQIAFGAHQFITPVFQSYRAGIESKRPNAETKASESTNPPSDYKINSGVRLVTNILDLPSSIAYTIGREGVRSVLFRLV